ncbi:MAG: N-acetylmuramoyl-L-alanine amidase CwlD [Lachnospiraceae bacterium]|nr:N-acetylmuramoyl-L-alanine amidase CwlD [Lachnospiraceae bacterium]
MKNRRKLLECIMAVVLLLLVYICAGKLPAMNAGSSQVTKEEKEEKKVVLLDAGHGGVDPGKIAVTGVKEKDINLQIALKTEKLLKKAGYEVVMTRESDSGLYEESDSNKKIADMKKRCLMAEESHADILVSIHQNSYQSEGVKGAQVFYYSHSEEGKKLAEILQEKFKENVDPENGRMAKANDSYYILLNVKCPAVIAECGFLSNYQEAELLEDEKYQEKVAKALTEGIVSYFEE